MKIIASHIMGHETPVEFDDSGWIIEFHYERNILHVAIGPDGKINISSITGTIKVEPRAANVVWVSQVNRRE